jgi:hypothetical protein
VQQEKNKTKKFFEVVRGIRSIGPENVQQEGKGDNNLNAIGNNERKWDTFIHFIPYGRVVIF